MTGKYVISVAILVIAAVVFSAGPSAGQWYPIGRAFVPVPPPEAPPPAPPATMPMPVEPGNTMMGTTGVTGLLGGTLETGGTLQITTQTEGAAPGIPGLVGSPVLSGPYALPATDTDIALAASGIAAAAAPLRTAAPGGYQVMQTPPGGAFPGAITQPFGAYPVFGGSVASSYATGAIPSTSAPPGVRTVPGVPAVGESPGTTGATRGTTERR